MRSPPSGIPREYQPAMEHGMPREPGEADRLSSNLTRKRIKVKATWPTWLKVSFSQGHALMKETFCLLLNCALPQIADSGLSELTLRELMATLPALAGQLRELRHRRTPEREGHPHVQLTLHWRKEDA